MMVIPYYTNCFPRLTLLYPALEDHEDHGKIISAITNQQQAVNQLLAGIVTMAIAIGGGIVTGT